MASAVVNIDVSQLERLKKAFDSSRLDAAGKSKLLSSLALEVEEITRERFDTKLDPEGKSWRRLADKTLAFLQKRFPGAQPPLVVSGGLRDTVTSEARGAEEVLVGAVKEYAAVHQFGWPEKNIPARPYLGVSASDAEALSDLAESFIAGRFKQAAERV